MVSFYTHHAQLHPAYNHFQLSVKKCCKVSMPVFHNFQEIIHNLISNYIMAMMMMMTTMIMMMMMVN